MASNRPCSLIGSRSTSVQGGWQSFSGGRKTISGNRANVSRGHPSEDSACSCLHMCAPKRAAETVNQRLPRQNCLERRYIVSLILVIWHSSTKQSLSYGTAIPAVRIVLVDRPIEGRERYLYDADENGNQRIIDLPSQPLLDYRDICNFAGTNAHTEHHGLGLLDALTCSWNQEALQFDRKNPTLWSLACCPLQIVAKEWVRYIDVMRSSIMQYEYSSPDLLSTDHERNELRSDLNALRFWGRRFATARQDIEATLDFLYSNNASNSLPERSLSLLLDYYRRKSTVVKDQSRQVDEKISVVVSLINSGNGRPAEVAYPGTADRNIARLTGLTLVFVCRAFISSVFGASFANRLGVMYFPIRLVVDLILAYLWLHSTFPERVDIRAHWHTLYEYGARLFARPS
ncbi:hypothetical protein EV356DRAFT_517924 [Viridothelium virens]|uniref:Uncharacterized protein n=1 Tax=Viridothelium virens TaxID=1048519 RepID=A0A6A6HLH5_VIRVR|nr:hypothetical protein EV356DRAFT_517924 [Viridothelium virens]